MLRVVLFACIALGACKSSDKSSPSTGSAGSSAMPGSSALSGQKLAERVRDAIVAALPDATVTITDPQTIKVKRADATEVEMALENLELKCRGGEAVCSEAITSAIANITQKPADTGIAIDKLVVTIKSKQWFDDTDKMLRTHEKYDENKLTSEKLPGDVVAVLGVDRPNGIAMVSAGMLADAKLDAKTAFDHAKKNLRAMYTTLKVSLMEGTPVYTNDEDDNYISATILLPELWKPLAAKVKGDLLVGFPSRNRVFATGSSDDKAVLGLSNIAGVAFQTEDHPITKTIFKWSATGWTVHAVP